MEKARSIEGNINGLVTDDGGAEKKIGFFKKAKIIVTDITVEPILVLYVLPSAMAMLAVQNLNLEKACRVNLAMDKDICDALAARNSSGYNETDEAVVQKLVATMYAWKNVLQNVLPSILLFFAGSWSDRHKRRKPCILIPIFGEIISCVGFLLCTFFFYQLSIEFVVFSDAVPSAVTGAWTTCFMGLYSYISNITTKETRTLRIGAISLFATASSTVGVSLSGVLFKVIGYYGVFSLSLTMYVCGLLYGCWKVKETDVVEKKPVEDEKRVGFIRDFFDTKHISETFRVALKKGDRNRRARICTVMVLVVLIFGPAHGEFSLLYLYVRYKFGWNSIDYSLYLTYNAIIHAAGTFFSLMFFSKFLKLDDSLLGVISCTSKICANFVYAFAPTSLIFFAGPLVEILNGTSFIAMRSIISKLVPASELGKIYSLFYASEAVVPLIYSPLFSYVYKSTIDIFPGTYFLVASALTVPSVFIFIWLHFEHRKDAEEERKILAQKETLLKEGEKTQPEEKV